MVEPARKGGKLLQCLYVATAVVGKQMIREIQKRLEPNVIVLKTTRLPGGFYPRLWEVPELDDPDIASQVEILYADLPVVARYWKQMTNLKWVHTAWNGVDCLIDALDKSEALPTFRLTKTLGIVNAPLITEYVIGHIIATERLFFEAKELQKQTEWKQMNFAGKLRKLRNVTIGILGIGDIGEHLAKACKAFGMTVWGLTRRQRTEADASCYVDVFRTTDELADLLQNCDYICNILPSTDRTKHLLSGDVLSNCRNAVFINVGRGDIVDETSVLTALRNGWLRGAVLDVFEEEPLPASSPLWAMSNVVITPHVSGWSSQDEHMESVNDCFFTNYERYMSGKPLLGELDWNQGY